MPVVGHPSCILWFIPENMCIEILFEFTNCVNHFLSIIRRCWCNNPLGLTVITAIDDRRHNPMKGLHRLIDANDLGILELAISRKHFFHITIVTRIFRIRIMRMKAAIGSVHCYGN